MSSTRRKTIEQHHELHAIVRSGLHSAPPWTLSHLHSIFISPQSTFKSL